MLSRSNIIWFSVFLFLLLVSAGFFVLRILPVMREAESLSGQFQNMMSQRRELVSRPEGPPSEILLKAAVEATAEKEKLLRELEAELSVEVPALLPEGTTRPSIYWLDTLRRQRSEIVSRAADAGLAISPSLGFADGLPADGRVPDLLFRLYVNEELIGKALESGLRSISELRFRDAHARYAQPRGRERDFYAPGSTAVEASGIGQPVSGLEDMGIKKATLDFSIESSLENLLVFISSLRNASFMYNIEDMRFEAVAVERVEFEEADVPPERMTSAERRRRDEFFDERMEERIERRITERFLRVNMELSMYYTSGDGEAAIRRLEEGAPAGEELPDATRPGPGERSRIIR